MKSDQGRFEKIDALSKERYWQATMARDRQYDGTFVYAVQSTGIYCRPSCPARRPRLEQVTFFRLPEAAEQEGYRPCLRCRPRDAVISDPLVKLIQDVCRYIEDHDSSESPLTLASIGEHVDVSPYHLQKIFKRIMGITPRQYAEARRLGRLKPLIKKRRDVTTALYEAGYGSSSRLYERASSQLGMTPGTYLRGGKGMRIRYTIVDSPLGRLLVAVTEKGICAVSLGNSDTVLEAGLLSEYPAAEVLREDADLGEWVVVLLQHLNGWKPHLDLPLDVQVTTFQWRVYEELRTIPYGNTRSYAEIAKALGQPNAVRAVARACAENPAALVIPCHRVVRKDGGLGGYRWGVERKREILELEAQFSEQTQLAKKES